MANEKDRTAKLSVELEPANDSRGDTKCNCHIEGNVSSLMNAYEQMTTHLLSTLMEELGKERTMMLFSLAQTKALRAIGINVEDEAKEAAKKVETLRKLDALKDILGKTFTMPEKEEA